MDLRRLGWALVVAATVVAAGCEVLSTHPSPASSPQPRPTLIKTSSKHAPVSDDADPSLHGCGGTPIHRGDPPAWATGAEHGFHGPDDLPYVVSDHGLVVAYLFGYPLAVENLGPRDDKILWFVKQSYGTALHVDATLDGGQRRFSQTLSGGDGIPSVVHAPAPGCWRLDLSWGSDAQPMHDSLSILYVRHRS